MTTREPIRGTVGYAAVRGLVTFIAVRLDCPAEPDLDRLYLGRSMTEAAIALAELNDRREALGLAVVVV